MAISSMTQSCRPAQAPSGTSRVLRATCGLAAYMESWAWAMQKGVCNYSSFLTYEIDNNRNIHYFGNPNVGVDVTQAFHQYGVLWTNDGSPHGSVVVYFDGNPITSAYHLVSPGFDNGLFFDIYWSPDNIGGQGSSIGGASMQFDWIRAYQLAPN
jgi:beta-glucanase (GH16 family)